MRISDWSSDVCSSDLDQHRPPVDVRTGIGGNFRQLGIGEVGRWTDQVKIEVDGLAHRNARIVNRAATLPDRGPDGFESQSIYNFAARPFTVALGKRDDLVPFGQRRPTGPGDRKSVL